MTADEPLIVFTREGCHLCDLAVSMVSEAGLRWKEVDIDTDPELVREYGNHVPVLHHPGSGKELYFPFDVEQVRSLAGSGPLRSDDFT